MPHRKKSSASPEAERAIASGVTSIFETLDLPAPDDLDLSQPPATSLTSESGPKTEVEAFLIDVSFSNRPFEVKRFQTIHHRSVDVARGLVLLSGIGTRAVPIANPIRWRLIENRAMLLLDVRFVQTDLWDGHRPASVASCA